MSMKLSLLKKVFFFENKFTKAKALLSGKNIYISHSNNLNTSSSDFLPNLHFIISLIIYCYTLIYLNNLFIHKLFIISTTYIYYIKDLQN